MTKHSLRMDPPGNPQLGQRVLDHKERWLGEACLIQLTGGSGAVLCVWIKQLANINIKVMAQEFSATINMFPENWFVLIEFLSHCHILCSLAREKKSNRASKRFLRSAKQALRILGFQNLDSLSAIAAHKHLSVLHDFTAKLQRIRDISQRKIRSVPEMLRESGD